MRDSIEKLTAHIQNQPHLDEIEKEELLQLVEEIQSEVEHQSTHEDLGSVADSVHMASGIEENSFPHQLEENLLKIEAAYPKTAAALGRIADVLSRMGI
ncbi:MAG: DUF4404 family protein [Verrucomicrobiae bacterium]|nr:DUF4404 family protein [Verrucomicrobiae bacterium]MCB1088568.1 DUF4404 family protein [Verrucomicrobiae bacterium]MCB1090598.1 DUF4404 family protein [Verrucomicrobiae bacterium]